MRMIEDAVWNLEGKTVTLLGLAFKPGTDDVRGAPALRLAARLIDEGSSVVGYDPLASAAAEAAVPGLQIAADPYEAATGSACLVLCTEWPDLLDLDASRLKDAMVQPAVVDARNALDASAFTDEGFVYLAVGRPAFGG